ncbi:MAG: hypothetical protein [Microviridae sp.]|nr:MAG: hypothetical protein [Microviridae sp.]
MPSPLAVIEGNASRGPITAVVGAGLRWRRRPRRVFSRLCECPYCTSQREKRPVQGRGTSACAPARWRSRTLRALVGAAAWPTRRFAVAVARLWAAPALALCAFSLRRSPGAPEEIPAGDF